MIHRQKAHRRWYGKSTEWNGRDLCTGDGVIIDKTVVDARVRRETGLEHRKTSRGLAVNRRSMTAKRLSKSLTSSLVEALFWVARAAKDREQER
jgi:hypothetical protein